MGVLVMSEDLEYFPSDKERWYNDLAFEIKRDFLKQKGIKERWEKYLGNDNAGVELLGEAIDYFIEDNYLEFEKFVDDEYKFYLKYER
jgi:hypothetical protein